MKQSRSSLKQIPFPGVKKSTGFTLLELVLAIAVLTVLVSIAVPSLSALLTRQQELEVIGQLEQFLNEQRRRAIPEQTPRWVRFSANQRVLIAGWQFEMADSLLELPEGYTFEVSDFGESLTSEMLGDLGLSSQEYSWSPEVLYFSDGTSTELTQLVLRDQQPRLQLTLQPLNGSVIVERDLVDEEFSP